MRRPFLALFVVLFAGCATAPRPGVEEAHVWRHQSGPELIADGPDCHKVIQFNPQSNANEWVEVPCTSVVITHDSADETFWTFKAHPERKIQMTTMYGLVPVGPPIPAGRYAVTFRVVGSEAVCEGARQSIARGRPVNDLESGSPGVPTEPCIGPRYFKRAGSERALKSEVVAPAKSEFGSSQIRPACNNHMPSTCPP
jgi:hypothetical protein